MEIHDGKFIGCYSWLFIALELASVGFVVCMYGFWQKSTLNWFVVDEGLVSIRPLAHQILVEIYIPPGAYTSGVHGKLETNPHPNWILLD